MEVLRLTAVLGERASVWDWLVEAASKATEVGRERERRLASCSVELEVSSWACWYLLLEAPPVFHIFKKPLEFPGSLRFWRDARQEKMTNVRKMMSTRPARIPCVATEVSNSGRRLRGVA